ncbi:MAG: glycosyltransferase family 4 protein [Polyangia bacterium]
MAARLAIVCTHPIQYLAPWYRHLAQQPGLEVTVLYGSAHGLVEGGYEPEFGRAVRWDVDLASGYRWELLRSHALRPDVTTFFGNLSLDVFPALRRERFDAVLIQGWNCALYPLALMAARRAGLPVLLRGDSVRLPDAVEPPVQSSVPRLLKQKALGRYLAACAAVLALSSGNRRRLRDLGVPAEKIFWSPLAVEGDRFALPAAQRQAARREVRAQLGLRDEGTPLVLFCAKLVPKKEPALLVRAFAALRQSGAPGHLVLAGEGPLRGEIEALVAALRIPEVTLRGFVNQAELPSLYAAADLLVLPSSREETFGLVVAEALHAGLPVIASDHVGCAEDLVRPGETGLIFRNRDEADLTRCLQALCAGPEAAALRARLGAGAVARMATWTYAESTAGLLAALAFALSGRRPGAR